jgi:hypothetical protein
MARRSVEELYVVHFFCCFGEKLVNHLSGDQAVTHNDVANIYVAHAHFFAPSRQRPAFLRNVTRYFSNSSLSTSHRHFGTWSRKTPSDGTLIDWNLSELIVYDVPNHLDISSDIASKMPRNQPSIKTIPFTRKNAAEALRPCGPSSEARRKQAPSIKDMIPIVNATKSLLSNANLIGRVKIDGDALLLRLGHSYA